jgi:hypothetical protein
MRNGVLVPCVAFTVAGLVHVGCGRRSAIRETGRETTADQSLSGASSLSTGAVPAHLQSKFKSLPERLQRRFLKMPERARQRLLSMPESRLDGLIQRASERSAARRARRTFVRATNTTPDAVFRTRPAVGTDGRIVGNSPLTVIFNTCPSTDADEGDQLKTTYDWDGDGIVDFRGTCRAEHTYTRESRPIICVKDRQPDNGVVCKSFIVEPVDRQAARSRCSVLTQGSDTTTGEYTAHFGGYFDVNAGTGIISAITTNAAADTGIAGNYFDCSAAFYGGAYAGSVVGVYSDATTYAAPAAYTACYAYVYSSNYDIALMSYVPATTSWSTRLCPPGAF